MKNTTLILTGIMIVNHFASAQNNAGSINLGGNLNFFMINDDQSKTKINAFVIGPSIDYYLKENFAIGLNLSYSGVTVANKLTYAGNDYTLKNKTNLFSINPFVRMHGKLNDKVSCYAEATINVGFGMTNNQSYDIISNSIIDNNIKQNTYGVSISPGIWWNIKPKVALTFQYGNLSYRNSKYNPEAEGQDSYTVSTFSFSLSGSSLQIGLYYALK